MPFKSPEQQRFIFEEHPDIAQRWAGEAKRKGEPLVQPGGNPGPAGPPKPAAQGKQPKGKVNYRPGNALRKCVLCRHFSQRTPSESGRCARVMGSANAGAVCDQFASGGGEPARQPGEAIRGGRQVGGQGI